MTGIGRSTARLTCFKQLKKLVPRVYDTFEIGPSCKILSKLNFLETIQNLGIELSALWVRVRV